jgi:glutaredoxin 3
LSIPEVLIYTKDWCSYCQAAKALLTQLGYAYHEIDVTHDRERYQEMLALADGRTTVPQIFFDGASIGGYTELSRLIREGKLGPAT